MDRVSFEGWAQKEGVGKGISYCGSYCGIIDYDDMGWGREDISEKIQDILWRWC